MQNIVVIGRRQDVLGFRAVGFGILVAETDESARDALKEAVRAGCGIIFITEDYCEKLSELIDRYKNSPLPAIIPLPGASGGTGYALNAVRKNVERAIGADILFRGE